MTHNKPNLHSHLRDAVEAMIQPLEEVREIDDSEIGYQTARGALQDKETIQAIVKERRDKLINLKHSLHTTLLNTITLTLQVAEEAGPGDKDEDKIDVPQSANIGEYRFCEKLRREGHNTANHQWRTALREMRESLEGNNEGV